MKHLIWLFILYSSTCLSGISTQIDQRPDQKYGYLYLFIPEHIEFTIEIITPLNLNRDNIAVNYFLSSNRELWVDEVYDAKGYIVPIAEYSKIIITYPDRKETIKAELELSYNVYNQYYFY